MGTFIASCIGLDEAVKHALNGIMNTGVCPKLKHRKLHRTGWSMLWTQWWALVFNQAKPS